LILKLITTLLCIVPILSFSQGIDFQEQTLQEALTQAKLEGKEVFIDGFATWCGPCKLMDASTFKDKKVGDLFNKSFVSIKLDMEKEEGLDVAKRFRVKAFPTFIFLNPQGEVLHKAAGYFEADDFLALAAVSQDADNRLGSLERKFRAGNRDIELLDDLLDQQFDLLDPHYMMVAHAKAELEENWDTDEMRSFIFKYTNSASSPLFAYLVEHKNEFYDQFGEGATFGKIEKLVRDRSFEIEETSIDEMAGIFKLVYPKQAKQLKSITPTITMIPMPHFFSN